jgi:hypothetical protein
MKWNLEELLGNRIRASLGQLLLRPIQTTNSALPYDMANYGYFFRITP